MEEELLAYMDFSQVDQLLNSIFGTGSVNASDLIEGLMKGDFKELIALLTDYVQNVVLGNLHQCKNVFLTILFLGILAILLNGLGDLFHNSKMELFAGYFIYMFSSLVLLKCLGISYENAKSFLTEMEQLIGVLMPAFCITMGMANGPVTAAAFYELQFLLLLILERILVAILLPMVQIYGMLHVLNRLPEGNRFGGVQKIVKKCILFVTKISLFAALVSSMLQATLLPVVDNMQSRLLSKTVSLFPGMGDYADVITKLLIQGATLIKGCVGILGLFVLAVLCLRPVLITLMYGCVIRLASAILQVSGEKKFTEHIWEMADSFFLLARIQLFGSGMFFVAITVAASAFSP